MGVLALDQDLLGLIDVPGRHRDRRVGDDDLDDLPRQRVDEPRLALGLSLIHI